MATTPGKGKKLRILLVEDNEAHAELVRRTLESHEVSNEIFHVVDGEAALDYLFARGEFEGIEEPPHLILLDVRLPKVDGLEVLQEIRKTDDLESIPIVMLTTSASERDVLKAYELHANSYVVKPLDFIQFEELMKDLGFYWLAWNQRPGQDPGSRPPYVRE